MAFLGFFSPVVSKQKIAAGRPLGAVSAAMVCMGAGGLDMALVGCLGLCKGLGCVILGYFCFFFAQGLSRSQSPAMRQP